jgi:SiaC family regulatory phosphoprotein
MEHLRLKITKYTVKVDFDPETGILELEGASYPENASEFYQPIFNWINRYITDVKKNILLNLRLNYLNTSSTKCMLDILDLLEEYYEVGGEVTINWYYAEGDEDILETGEEFAEDSKVPMNLIPYKEDEVK